jgi:hypothetical protein
VSVTLIGEWVLSGAVLAGIGWTAVRAVLDQERRAKLLLRARFRAPRAERAAVEASLDASAFAPEVIRASVGEILGLAASSWQGSGSKRLQERADRGVISAWARSRARRLGSGLSVVGTPRVEILGVLNREKEGEDRVIARVHIRVRRAVRPTPIDPTVIALDERWTLARNGDGWVLASVEGDPVAGAVVSAPLISSPSQDSERLREASLRELSAEGFPAERPGELVDGELSPEAELADLAVADDRFSPLLINATIIHLVEAWESASDGQRGALLAVATHAAVHELLQGPESGTRRFVKDASLKRSRVVGLDAASDPPRVEVRVRVDAAVYTVHGKYVAGSDRHRGAVELIWTLELTQDRDGQPQWRLCASENL